LRIQFAGAYYHVACRGNERRPIFRDDVDRRTFLERLERSLDSYGVRLSCYVLMRNHYHLLIETPKPNLSEFMMHFNGSYTMAFNRRHRRSGHLYPVSCRGGGTRRLSARGIALSAPQSRASKGRGEKKRARAKGRFIEASLEQLWRLRLAEAKGAVCGVFGGSGLFRGRQRARQAQLCGVRARRDRARVPEPVRGGCRAAHAWRRGICGAHKGPLSFRRRRKARAAFAPCNHGGSRPGPGIGRGFRGVGDGA